MKKFISLFLTAIMIVFAAVPITAASGASLSISTSASALSGGDVITVEISLGGSENYKSIALVFDYDTDNVFEIVSGEWKLSGTLLSSFDKTTTKAGTAAAAFANETNAGGKIFTLKLKVKANAPSGNAVISVTPTIKNGSASISCSSASKTVKIGNSCEHRSKTFVKAKQSTCTEMGWDAYYKCDSCKQLFSSNQTEISAIPLLPLKDHTFGEWEINGNTATRKCVCGKTESKTVIPEIEIDDEGNIEWDNPFSDISESDAYYNAIGFVYINKLFIGISDTLFAPHKTMTRAMFVTVLGRLAGVDQTKYEGTSFDDVKVGEWYSAYVEWAAENGIVNGYGNGKFGVEDEVTVEQAVAIIARYARFTGIETEAKALSGYEDISSIDSWAVADMEWAVESDIYTGADGKLAPLDKAERALVATMICNFKNFETALKIEKQKTIL